MNRLCRRICSDRIVSDGFIGGGGRVTPLVSLKLQEISSEAGYAPKEFVEVFSVAFFSDSGWSYGQNVPPKENVSACPCTLCLKSQNTKMVLIFQYSQFVKHLRRMFSNKCSFGFKHELHQKIIHYTIENQASCSNSDLGLQSNTRRTRWNNYPLYSRNVTKYRHKNCKG